VVDEVVAVVGDEMPPENMARVIAMDGPTVPCSTKLCLVKAPVFYDPLTSCRLTFHKNLLVSRTNVAGWKSSP